MRSAFLPLVVPFLLVLAALVPSAAAQAPSADPNPAVGKWVEAAFDVDQPDLRTMALSGTLSIREYLVDDEVLTADDMGDRYVNVNRFPAGKKVGNEMVGDIEQQVSDSMRATLESSFPGATVTVEPAVVDRSTLRAASGNAYDPPVRIAVSATIARTSEQVGTGTLSDAAIDAVFKAGAMVESSFSLKAEPGYSYVYVIGAPQSPEGLVFEDAVGATRVDASTVRATIDNAAGSTTASQSVGLALRHATAAAPDEERMDTTIEIALGAPSPTGVPVAIDVRSDLRTLDLTERFSGNSLPESVTLGHLSADALRALVQTDAITEQDLADANAAFLDAIATKLADSGFDVGAPTGGIDEAELARAPADPYGQEPPLPFTASASGLKALENGDGDKLDLALRIGATVRFETTLRPTDSTTTTYVLSPPPGTEFVGQDGAGTDAATFTLSDAPQDVSLQMRLKDRPVFAGKSADLGIVVDLQDIDISIGKAAGGDMGNLVGEITIRGALGILSLDDLPEAQRQQLSGQADVTYLPSDGIRLALQKKILSDADLAAFEKDLLDKAGADIGNALGAAVTVSGGFDAASLAPGLISAGKLSGDAPIVFTATASFTKPLVGGGPPAAEAAIALYTQQQSFDLPKFQGLDTEYKVILPPGLAVTNLAVTGGASDQGTEDGRDWFTVSPTDESAHATVSMAVTPSFVLAKFWPVLLLAVLVIFLLVGTPIALVVMRRRRKAAAGAREAPQKK